MSRKHFILLMFVIAALVGAFSATAQDGKVLRIHLQQEADTLNPMYTQMWFAAIIHDLIYPPVWWIDNNQNAVPVLVTEIPSLENGGISEDGTSITLNLRDDIVWSDGEPITSADLVFTYEMYIAPENTPSSRYPYEEEVTSVEAPDERTVVVNFNEPFAAWQVYVFPNVLPEHVFRPIFEAEGTLDNAAENREPTVSGGPFIFESWETGSGMTLVRNDNYFNGTAKLDEIDIRFVPEDATIVASLLSGDADMATYIPWGDTPPLRDAGNIVFTLAPSGYNEHWSYNMDPETAHPAIQDVNVRRALAMAFNRDQINEDLNAGATYTPASFWEGTPYARPNAEPIPYDPEMAAQLLDEAGWVDSDGDGVRDKDGVALSLRYITNDRQIRKDVQAIVQQALGELGVQVETFNYPNLFDSYVDGGPLSTRQFDIAEWSAAPSFPDPSTTRFLCSQITSDENPDGTNDQGYCNEQVDALFAEQARTLDPAKRAEIFHQIDQLITDDVAWVGIWFDADLWTINEKVLNTEIGGSDPWWNAVNWDIAS